MKQVSVENIDFNNLPGRVESSFRKMHLSWKMHFSRTGTFINGSPKQETLLALVKRCPLLCDFTCDDGAPWFTHTPLPDKVLYFLGMNAARSKVLGDKAVHCEALWSLILENPTRCMGQRWWNTPYVSSEALYAILPGRAATDLYR